MEIKKITEYVQTLEEMSEKISKLFPGYIYHIRFPRFKNLAAHTCINFDFPVTALVGQNGSGKTSVLNALYGAPFGKSTGEYWFSTSVDPIKEGDGSPNRFIYGHYNSHLKTIVETIKARRGRKRGKGSEGTRRIDYWEPVRASLDDDIEAFPELEAGQRIPGLTGNADRWIPVRRNVIYLNFRRELSSFDKYFFFGSDPNSKILKHRQDVIRRDSKNLKKIIDAGDLSVTLRNKKIALINRELNETELGWIKYILGRDYKYARYIRHNLFKGNNGLSVQFKTNFGTYSEAFAGSGEVSIVSLVVQVLAAKKGDLILLDEPEVSLHPGAQERLVQFLLIMSIEKKVQTVYSTHSPDMVAFLPENAIKVFMQDQNGAFTVIPNSHPYAAFGYLGVQVPEKIYVIVEDELAKYVVDQALLKLDEQEQKIFNVLYSAGGSDAILRHRVPVAMDNGSNILFLMDGDKRQEDLIDPTTIPASDDCNLLQIIKDTVGVEPFITPDGHGKGNEDQKISLYRKYLSYVYTNLKYLPLKSPEEIVLKAAFPEISSEGFKDSNETKEALLQIAKELYEHEPTSKEINDFAKIKLLENKEKNDELEKIKQILKEFGQRVRPK